MSKEKIVNHLMLAITKLMQPLDGHDRSSFYLLLQPVCIGAGWYTPDGVRPLQCHEKGDGDVDRFVKTMGAGEATMLRGIYCKMIHGTEYPGDFLYDIAFCIHGKHNTTTLRQDFVALYNYDPFTLQHSQTNVLRLLYFICWGIKNGNITQPLLVAMWKNLPMKQANERPRVGLCFPKRQRTNYVKARERALSLVTDTALRGLVDGMVLEAYAGYIIGALAMVKGYINLITLISWDTMSSYMCKRSKQT